MSVAPAQATEPRRIWSPAWGVKRLALTLSFVGVLTGLGLFQVWQRYQVYRLGMQLSAETLRYRSLLDDNAKLKLELATLKRVGRIRHEAEERLHMRTPVPHDIVEIR